MSAADPVAVLRDIVEEVSGAGQSFSADSYLPAHLIHDARTAIESAPDQPASADQAYNDLMLARLQKADQIIVALRAEVESLRHANSDLATAAILPDGKVCIDRLEVECLRSSCMSLEHRVCLLTETNAALERRLESARSAQSVSHTGSTQMVRHTVYARAECDE